MSFTISDQNKFRLVGTVGGLTGSIAMTEFANAVFPPLPLGLRIAKIGLGTIIGAYTGELHNGCQGSCFHSRGCSIQPRNVSVMVGTGYAVQFLVYSIGEAVTLALTGHQNDNTLGSLGITFLTGASAMVSSNIANHILDRCFLRRADVLAPVPIAEDPHLARTRSPSPDSSVESPLPVQ